MPTLGGFLLFIRNTMGVSTGVLPDGSPVVSMSFDIAKEMVNTAIASVSSMIYTLAVYNLAGSNVIQFAQDQGGSTFFADLRKKWNVNDFIPGVVTASGDEGTSQTLIVQEAAKEFTLQNLQNLKDPYGRQYLAFAQAYGPSIVGLS